MVWNELANDSQPLAMLLLCLGSTGCFDDSFHLYGTSAVYKCNDNPNGRCGRHGCWASYIFKKQGYTWLDINTVRLGADVLQP